MEVYDITIIGAGPAGMFAGFYAGMRNAKTKIIDSLPQLGGQLSTLYPEKNIYDIPGYVQIKANDLVQVLEKKLQTFPHTYCLGEEVIHIEKQEDLIVITTNKETHYTKAAILALGNGSFQPRKLNVPGAENFENRGLDYYVNDLMKYAGKKVALAGGGDSAIDWALMLEPIAAEVHLIHRRDKFRALEHSVEKLYQSSVNIMTPYVISEVTGKDFVDGITLQQVQTKEKIELAVDHLLVNYGFTSNLNVKEWNLAGTRQTITVNSDMSTSIAGIYACGDIAGYDGKVKLIATGFGEAPTAVNNALHFIDPKNRTQPAHSTSLF
ncbi:NAD(P)/FAD-dependent oxidoreductase [Enterococcus dispar]|jgi:thioredoxin reductase (NADPH)|uniref:Ferredoxin--NADP reductase n=1 Tax=Enterococcus dispar ATCC 51266 TaxID=1139219 RepID=S1ND67_9ENTE|nr:NAD(P)/FAD-dependent oxidoreductase [Enterococcus dispar]EOT41394.1 ferredoxin-NADP reductase [Enterococcus dispar ATCC 51266]EOW86972.1 ferredoxin-NADP reductase [Enterococcus dispar ATCC 51266]MCU7357877.1 NAD(P)/FAD-dependent oxidoreductase [Enterococcus dispar]OJG37863.1 ferredoxin-NADP reductase [Enterococcus dispar]WCG34016.1 NAD(P)/FAD-dependent oxidoreductase [Enterococcus dispar]